MSRMTRRTKSVKNAVIIPCQLVRYPAIRPATYPPNVYDTSRPSTTGTASARSDEVWGLPVAAIFGGWLGGLLAPSQAIPVTTTVPVTKVTRTETKTVDRPGHSLIPAFGRKGGERVEKVDEVHTSRVDKE